jgi:predicted aldo/keto reductase-like oxidoreductase
MSAEPPSSASGRGPSRRALLAGVSAAAALAQVVSADPPPAPERPPQPPVAPRPMPQRDFGRTGLKVSVFGLGCFPLGGLAGDDEAVALVRLALDVGCTYFDTAPSYGEGSSERRLGLALRGRPRASYVLATKTHTRTAREARLDVERSLERLGVQQLDLVQVHAVSDKDDLERALAKDGPVAALVKAREEGLVRFVGLTGHRDPAVMATALERHPFDALLVPLNCVDPHHRSFVTGTLPTAVKKGVARVAMKVFASGNLPRLGVDPRACLRFAYGLDVATAIVGCTTPEQVRLAAEVAAEAARLTPEEERHLLGSTHPHRGASTEWYKRQE